MAPSHDPTRGVDGELPTLPVTEASAGPVDAVIADDAVAMFRAAAAARYVGGEQLGMGGMGEVRAAGDRATGRVVAVKTVRADQAGSQALRRFAREARIQAQLEHPSIVPVYDVGVDAAGALYFTMKRIRGDSLAEVIERVRTGAADARYSRRRLLTVMAQVAMTVAYAHRRGVLHRDLKPSNVMLGEFGEVYVLDWGLAHVRGSDDAAATAAPGPTALVAQLPAEAGPVVDSSVRPDTASGHLLGTPGYAAPELVEHGSTGLDQRADVYALGVMLYEVLTLERLHGGGGLGQVLGSTLALDGAEAPAAAAVPPELAQLCRAATRRDPAHRLGSAAELARGLDAYLDGDRDLAERRRLADERTDLALAALTNGPEPRARTAALRDVVTALGLEPGHPRARAALVRLLTEPDASAEAAAEAAHRPAAIRSFRHAARTAMLALATYLLYVPLVLWMGVRSWPMLGTMAAAIGAVIAVTAWFHHRPPAGLRLPWIHLALSTVALSTGVFVAGPLLLLPTVAIATGVGYITAFDRRNLVTIAAMVGVVLAPFGLQVAGVLPASYRFTGDAIEIVPGMTHLPATPTIAFLAVTHAVVLVAALLFAWRLRQVAASAERRLRVQAWQLAQLGGDDAG